MSDDLSAEAAFKRLRKSFNVATLADSLGVTPQAVRAWRKFPAEKIVEIERLTGLDRSDMRPDLFLSPRAPKKD